MTHNRFVAGLASLALYAVAVPASAAKFGAWGVDLSDQDRSIQPGDNFAMYQNGGWFARTALQPSQPNAAFWRDLRIAAGQRVNEMLAKLGSSPTASANPTRRMLGDFHRSAMDEATIDARGLAPFQVQLNAIRSVRDKGDFARLMGSIEGPGTVRQPTVRANPGRDFYQLRIGQDQQDPARYAVYVSQSGLILPGPEYYVDPSFADLKAAYQGYVAKMLGRIGWPEPDRNAQRVVELESQIARVSSSHEQLRDATRTYHRRTLAELSRSALGFDWSAFFEGAGLPSGELIAVDVPQVIGAVAQIYAATPLDVLQAKQAFGAAHVDAARLDAQTYGIYRKFAETALAGLQAGPSRTLDAINLLNASVPDAVGAVYVQTYFSPEVKAKASDMALRIKAAFDRRIQASAVLSQQGKAAARAKLAALRLHIAYPTRFEDYAGLVVKPDDFYGNVSRAAAYNWREQVVQLKRPFDRSQWQLKPYYPQYAYLTTTNTMEIPAALLVPPFFDLNADDAVNYGADGTVIGWEIASAFVDSGLDYDAQGRLREWLPPKDELRLRQEQDKLAARYSLEEPLPGMHLKGQLVAAEAMADTLGVEAALDAYQASLGGRSAPTLDGLTGDQRFFLGRAQMWRAKFSPEFTRNQVATGTNAPPYMRINGPLANIAAWYSAFGVKSGDKLYVPPSERLRLW